jgi:hypothetical protein
VGVLGKQQIKPTTKFCYGTIKPSRSGNTMKLKNAGQSLAAGIFGRGQKFLVAL